MKAATAQIDKYTGGWLGGVACWVCVTAVVVVVVCVWAVVVVVVCVWAVVVGGWGC